MAATQRAVSPPSDQPPATAPPRTPTSFPTHSHAPTTTSTGKADTLRPKHSNLGPTSNPRLSPKTATSKSPQPRPRSRSPIPLTGAAAVAEARRRDRQEEQQKAAAEGKRTSPNPAVQAMQALMGGGGISRPSDSPAPNKLSEPMRRVAEKITIPSQTQGDSLHASPTSMSSYGSVESTGPGAAMTATSNNFPENSGHHSYVAEPADMESGQYPENGHLNVNSDDGAKAFSYPGPPPQEAEREGAPSRGMSLPGYGQTSPKSPAASTKRHKCPYCSTDFTRHHNLKSHLLTHSQEKPYVCQTCNARFRRLHDLKRHTKLHTGERPHTCDKCGRRFARGDALARHNKGPGGCAGRRSSAGGEDDFGMDGVDYPGDEDDDVDMDPHARRVSEPSRKRAHLETPQDVERQVYRQHSSTYPPPAIPPHARGDMAPPQVVHPNAGAATSPRDMSGQPSPAMNSYYNGSSGQVFPQQAPMMTESPKPLSPGQPSDQHRLSVTDPNATSARNRSPSLASQLQQQHLSRASAGGGGRTPPQHPSAQFPSHSAQQPAPQLPPLPIPAIASSQRGPGPAPYSNPGPSSLHHQQIPPASASNAGSMSSHGRSSGSSLRDVLGSGSGSGSGASAPEVQGAPGPDIWAHVRGLEARFGRMQDEYELRISRMQEEIFALKALVAGSGGSAVGSGGSGGYGGGEAALQRH